MDRTSIFITIREKLTVDRRHSSTSNLATTARRTS
jgi:hypothetical protein